MKKIELLAPTGNKDSLSYIYEPKEHFDHNEYFRIGINVLRDNKEV